MPHSGSDPAGKPDDAEAVAAAAAIIGACVLDWLREGADPTATAVDGDAPLPTLGLDSVGAALVAARVEKATGVQLTPDLVYECQTVNELARFLAGRRGVPRSVEPAPTPAEPAHSPPAELPAPAPPAPPSNPAVGFAELLSLRNRRIDDLKAAGRYYYETPFAGHDGPRSEHDGRSIRCRPGGSEGVAAGEWTPHWTPAVPIGSSLAAAGVEWVCPSPRTLEVVGLDRKGFVYWSEFDLRSISDPRSRVARGNHPDRFLAACRIGPGAVAAVTGFNAVVRLTAAGTHLESAAGPAAIPGPARAAALAAWESGESSRAQVSYSTVLAPAAAIAPSKRRTFSCIRVGFLTGSVLCSWRTTASYRPSRIAAAASPAFQCVRSDARFRGRRRRSTCTGRVGRPAYRRPGDPRRGHAGRGDLPLPQGQSEPRRVLDRPGALGERDRRPGAAAAAGRGR